MPRHMADSVTATDIPPGVFELVAGYVDGLYKWTDQDWLFHHSSRLVTITAVDADPAAQVADVETGALTPQAAAQWAIAKRGQGYPSTVYVQASRFQEVVNAFNAAGAPYPLFWIADWDGVFSPWYGSIAKQYANPTLSGGHYDLSWVADNWPGIDPPGTPAPAPIPIPPPAPPPAPPLDGVRAAYADLAGFLTVDLPGGVAGLGLVSGLLRQGF